MAANSTSWFKHAGTAFLFLFGLFSIYVVWFAMNNKDLVGEGMFYEVFFGALAIVSLLWVVKRIGLWPGGNDGSPTS